MANTITTTDRITAISQIDSDWSWSSTFPASGSGIMLNYVMLCPGHKDDKLVVKEGSVSGSTVVCLNCSGTTMPPFILNLDGEKLRPCLDFSGGSYSTGCQMILCRT